MNVIRGIHIVTSATLAAAIPGFAQQAGNAQQPSLGRLVADPVTVVVRVGDSVPLRVTAYDSAGRVVPGAEVRIGGRYGAVSVDGGYLKGFVAGTHTVVATWRSGGADRASVSLDIPVTVSWPALTRIVVTAEPGRLYSDVNLGHRATGFHANGSERPGLEVAWRSSDPAVAGVDRFGTVSAHQPGPVTISAHAEGVKADLRYDVLANPVTHIEIGIRDQAVKTGDVIHLAGTARRANGEAVPDAPITWSFVYTPDDSIQAPGASGIVDGGLFAANHAGRYTILAQSGAAHARTVVEVLPRDVRRRISVTGRGTITNSNTSDLWPWTGKDGRDYSLVGTWGGDGWAMVYDITDLDHIVKTDSVKVDARTINDVTVSPDGRYGALSREGASNRVNGVVILDLANPAHPKVAATFDKELTGGVHNMFATNDHLFAVSGGAKYVILDMTDIYAPKYVSEYRHPNARLHDLWVRDGIAYSAQGGVGAVVVDVGNGKYGGTIEKPKLINVFPVNSGHEIFPYFQVSTGKTYLFIGDEVMSRAGRVWEGTNYWGTIGKSGGVAQTSGGYTHIVDFTDPMNPKKVARYHIEDFGTHDIIVEDDVLYQAYYDGGVRLVDVSGELLGNLHDQGREIAVFKPYDPEGRTANAPFVMNAMPWKGRVLFTDFNTGLWSAKLEPKRTVTP